MIAEYVRDYFKQCELEGASEKAEETTTSRIYLVLIATRLREKVSAYNERAKNLPEHRVI